MCILVTMRALLIALVFVAVFYITGMFSDGHSSVQVAAIVLCGLVFIWYALRAICCACGKNDNPGCDKPRSDGTV